jgi:serine/threonine-protein phosphatase 6 regulatory ankyrin repeat subunit B
LATACEEDNGEVVEYLLTQGELSNENVGVHDNNFFDRTPLLLSAREGSDVSIQVLINHIDSIVNPRELKLMLTDLDDSGRSALHLIADQVHYDTKKEQTDVYHKCMTMILENLKNVLTGSEFKEFVSLADTEDRDTPLHITCGNTSESLTNLLLKYGANPAAKDENDRTPLMHASKHEHSINIIKRLVKAKKQILDIDDHDSNTAVHFAAENGRTDNLEQLVWEGAEIMVKNCKEETPLHLAAKFGHSETVHKILDLDYIPIDIEDKSKMTPLMSATKGGHYLTVIELLAKDAKPFTMTSYIFHVLLTLFSDTSRTSKSIKFRIPA